MVRGLVMVGAVETNQAAAAKGQKVFAEQCVSCHGTRLRPESAAVREKIASILKSQLGGESLEYTARVSESPLPSASAGPTVYGSSPRAAISLCAR